MAFQGKVALVTGASSGIGAATVEVFAQKGANVVLVGRNAEKLKITEEKCRTINKNVEILVLQMDVTKDAEKIINETIAKFGRLDVLVNNAGVAKPNYFKNSTLEELDFILNTNLRAIYVLTKLAVPHLIKTKGNIVNVSSSAGIKSYPLVFNYGISKAALDQFTKTLALELAPEQVRVNSVNPTTMATDLFTSFGMTPEQSEAWIQVEMKKHPLGRVGDVYECAKSIAFLASNDASFITGTLLGVDGGRLLSGV